MNTTTAFFLFIWHFPFTSRFRFNVETRMCPPDSCVESYSVLKLPISISFASSPLVRPVGHSVIPTPIRSWRCSCSQICREEPVFVGKVTCGVEMRQSGQSWPSNTVATDPFTGQNRNSKCGSGVQHKRLGGWRPKTLYLPFQTLRYIGIAARGVLSSLPFSPINLDKGPSAAAMDVRLARLPATAPIAGSQTWTGG